MKICIKCKEEKEIENFYKNKQNKDGYSGKCKECTKDYVKKYREENLDLVKERVNKYRENNKEKSKEYSKLWREENKEYKKEKDKEYREKNKEILLQKKKEYRIKNRDLIRERDKKWREENKEKKKERDRIYSYNNRDKRNERHYKRYNNDPIYCISHIIRGLIQKSFINNKYNKDSKTQEILGCSFEGDPKPTVSWSFKNKELKRDHKKIKLTIIYK